MNVKELFQPMAYRYWSFCVKSQHFMYSLEGGYCYTWLIWIPKYLSILWFKKYRSALVPNECDHLVMTSIYLES